MKKFLFIGAPLPPKAYGWVALFLRLFVGILMLTHAFPKIANYPTLSLTFPDPLGIGSQLSLLLTLLAEGLCSLLVIAGALTRLAVLPLVFDMCIAAFVVHAGQGFAQKELAVLYLGLPAHPRSGAGTPVGRPVPVPRIVRKRLTPPCFRLYPGRGLFTFVGKKPR